MRVLFKIWRNLCRAALALLAALCLALLAHGCRPPAPSEPAGDAAGRPTLRLFLLSNVAGVLEPCGCTSDQLGGLDHLAALIEAERTATSRSLVLAAGPLLFATPALARETAPQLRWKAEAVALAMSDIGLAAWAPGASDWADGAATLGRLRALARADLLGAKLDAAPAIVSRLYELRGVAVGVLGVSAPAGLPGAVRAEARALVGRGARLLVALVAMPRGEALRLAEAVPELDLMLLGKPSEPGELDDEPPEPTTVASTLVVQTANHGRAVAIVDVLLAPAPEASAGARPGRAQLHLAVREVREAAGTSPRTAVRLRDYYRRVDEHNARVYADARPPPVPDGQAGYVGAARCGSCHEAALRQWQGTAHARAHETLTQRFAAHNFDCVPCHVTGYGQPGGATVTWGEPLRGVGCEECHGPGSLHCEQPEQQGLVRVQPEPQSCAQRCHRPPHVRGFDPVAKMALVLGPGHGR
ncbi:MAG: hypothetical protein HY744_14360 [Deltaproteobacteria bacterium]|nr:hypothetical protein [Deltaproteobacteria bacterium]